MTIRKRNDSWEYRFDVARVNGKRKQISKSGFKTKKECEKEALKALAYYQNGGLVVNYENISFADLLDLWYETNLPTWKIQTAKNYKIVMEAKVKPVLGSFRVKSITPLSYQNFINKIYEENSPAYAKLIRAISTSALRYAVSPLGILNSSPSEYIKTPYYKPKQGAKCVDLDVLRKAYNEIEEPYSFALLVALHTGMRIGEVFGLCWRDIDLKGKTITVNRTVAYSQGKWLTSAPKTKKSQRVIPYGEQLSLILEQIKAYQLKNKVKYGEYYIKNYVMDDVINETEGIEMDFLLTRPWGSFTDYHTMEKKCKKYGFKFHEIRHLHATSLIDSGINAKIVQERLGHSNIAITLQTYTHPSEEAQREAVEIFEKNVGEMRTNQKKAK